MGCPKRSAASWLPSLAFCLWALPLRAAVSIDLHASPETIPADGISQATITATVRDGDSTASTGSVVFSANAGGLTPVGGGGVPQLTLVVPIENGTARCLLQATTFPTEVQIIATTSGLSGSASGRVALWIGERQQQERTADRIIRVTGETIAYAPETDVQVMEVFGNAEVRYRGIIIRANYFQIDLQSYSLLARDFANGVTIGLEEPPYTVEQLADGTKPPYGGVTLGLGLLDLYGAVFNPLRGETIIFSGPTLVRQPDIEMPVDSWEAYDLSEVRVWVRARRAAIYPHDKIRFDHAKFQVDGVTVLSQPYYFEYLGWSATSGPAISQVINYSTQDGWIVDLPYYFEVGDRHTNEFRLTRGVSTGLFGRRSGFQLGYSHHTDLPDNRGQFEFAIDELGPDFGLRYDLQQRFGPSTFGTLSLAWPQHRNFYSSATLYTPVGPGNLSASLNVDYLTGFSAGLTSNANLVWQSNSTPLGFADLRFSTSLGAGYSRSILGNERWRQSISLNLTKRPWYFFGQSGRFAPYLGLRLHNVINGEQELALTFNATYYQQLGSTMHTSLGYTFDKTWSSRYNLRDRHLLSFNWMLNKDDRLTGYAFANYNLADATLSASMLLEWLFTDHLGVLGQTVYQSSAAGSFSETELWLYRVLGARELRLRYAVETGRLFFEIDNRY